MQHSQPLWQKLMRVRGLIRKETFQILRDPSSIALALVMPVVLLILFGYGVTFDAENIEASIVLESHGPAAERLASAFEGSHYFVTRRVDSSEADRLLSTRGVACVIRLRPDFDRMIRGGIDAPVQVLLDGVDANRARLINGYAAGVVASFNATLQRDDTGQSAPTGAVVRQRIWFNPELDSQDALVPGLLSLILTLTGILLTALVYVRERERGTLEALLVTPIRSGEIMLAKLVPYFALGMGGLILTVILGRLLFGVPMRGSWLVLLAMSSCFMLASLGIGLLISVAAPGQMVASQGALVVGFLPAFFLSGLLFDLQAQPAWTRVLSRFLPTTYFIDANKTIFLAGDDWRVLGPDLAVLATMAVVLLTAARLLIRKRIA